MLKSWEGRLAKQVKLFNKASSDVLEVDKAIITYTTKLYSIRAEQQEIRMRQENMDSRIDQIAQQQNSLSNTLKIIEESFSKKLEGSTNPTGISNLDNNNTSATSATFNDHGGIGAAGGSFSGNNEKPNQNMRISAARANALSSELQDIESQVETLMSQLNNLHERIYPSPLSEIVKILNMHQLTLQSIENEAQRLKEKINLAEDCLVRR